MEFNLFGLKLGKNKKPLASSENQKIKRSFALPQNDDDSITVESVGGFYGLNIDLDGTTRNDAELIYKYREMSMHAECEAAIDDIVCDAIVSEDNAVPVKIILDNIEHSDTIKRKIIKEFNNILVLLDFHTKGYEIFRRWYIDSKLVYHKITDPENPSNGIVEMRYVDPACIQKVKQYKRELNQQGQKIITGVDEYFIYSKDGFKGGVGMHAGTTSGIKISPDAVTYVTSGLFDSRNKRSVGHLQKAIKPLNQLRMMEDAVVIYRLSRAPERRIFYIDVGNLPKNKAEQYVQGLMNKYKNKLVYNPATGEVSDEKRHMSMLEDFWLPRREGGKGTEITTLQGAQNLSELEDVKYFQKKLYKALGVPLSRMDGEQKSFTIGKSTEIQRDEIKFSKMVSRLRNKFSELFYDALKTQLILKKIVTPEDWEKMRHRIFFDYLKDSYFAELKNNELTQERTQVLNNVQPYVGVYYSQYWVKKNILGLNDEEIAEMQAQIDQEKQQAVAYQQAAQQQQQQQSAPPEGDPNFQRNQMGQEDPNAQQQQQPDPNATPQEISPSAMANAEIPVTGKEQPRL